MEPKILIERIPAPFASIYEKATAIVIVYYALPRRRDRLNRESRKDS
jgi:hypothetical protein